MAIERTAPQFNKNSAERKSKRTKSLFLVMLLLIVVFAGLIAFVRNQKFQIKEVQVTGTQSIDSEKVKSVAAEVLKGNYAGIIPKTNVLLFSKSKMLHHVKDQIPGIESGEVMFIDRNTIRISIVEKNPTFVWCNEKCYFVDRTGILYEESPTFSQGVFITFTGMAPTGTIVSGESPLKKRFASMEDFNATESAVAALGDYPVHILGIKLLETDAVSGTQDMIVQIDQIKGVRVSSNAAIKITRDEDSATITGLLDLILADKTFAESIKTKGEALEYVDLRFAGKIYYKFANAVQASPEPTAVKADE